MRRLHRTLAAVGVLAVAAMAGRPACAQSAVPEGQTARLLRGSITGSVTDEHGAALAGAVVSALGATMAMTVTDERGAFVLGALPAGEYIIQAHLQGLAGSARARVQVGAESPVVHAFQLRKMDAPAGTAGRVPPVPARPIMAAGFGLPGATLSDEPDGEATADPDPDHPHTETAWRLRHIKRSILKDDGSTVVTFADGETEPMDVPSGSVLLRAVDSAAGAASSLFGDLPLSGEVNLLTTSAFAPGDMFSGDMMPRGVAYMALGAPSPGGAWSVRAAMSQGDLASWNVAGAFASRPGAAHGLDLGLSYSRQEYMGGNPAALAAVTDNSRNVGEMFAFDRWTVTRRVSVDYGARYAHYDYLQNGNLLSPRLAVSVEPIERTRLVASVAQRMLAPGAEEFLLSNAPGPWLPPERTFSPLGGGADPDLRVERARTVGLAVEHEFKGASVLSVQRFFQRVDDQMVTLFGLALPDGPDTAGHYFVESAGGVQADGWAVRVSNTVNPRLKGSIDYSVTQTRWLSPGELTDASVAAGRTSWRPAAEELHDITTSLETAIPETATRVVVIYKVNTGYSRLQDGQAGPALDGRFDLQLNQALPFDLAGTRWEVLFGIRNLFRDPSDPASVYDELLVVRPPKRVIGGFLVRF
jgi:hypothetical protein